MNQYTYNRRFERRKTSLNIGMAIGVIGGVGITLITVSITNPVYLPLGILALLLALALWQNTLRSWRNRYDLQHPSPMNWWRNRRKRGGIRIESAEGMRHYHPTLPKDLP